MFHVVHFCARRCLSIMGIPFLVVEKMCAAGGCLVAGMWEIRRSWQGKIARRGQDPALQETGTGMQHHPFAARPSPYGRTEICDLYFEFGISVRTRPRRRAGVQIG